MHLLSGDSGHVPSHDCPQNLSLGSSALSSPHTSWMSVCSAGHFSLLSFLPHKSTPFLAFSTGAAACWEPKALAALPLAGGGQQWGKPVTMAPARDWEGLPWL